MIGPHTSDVFDPNRLFDALLDQLGLENNEALSHALHIEPYLIKRIREHQLPLDPSLLIRISEVSGINMRDLRQIMGDRRAEYRLDTHPSVAAAPQTETVEKHDQKHEHDEGEEREKIRRSLENDDTGLPNFVQWS